MQISLFGLLGLPSSMYVISEILNGTGSVNVIVFIFAVCHTVVSIWLIAKGLQLIKNAETKKNL